MDPKWRAWAAKSKNKQNKSIALVDTLYYLNGPAIFTAFIGIQKFILYKSDESDDYDYFVATTIDFRMEKALRDGFISVRGALSQSSVWLMEVDFELVATSFEQFMFEDIVDFLPRAGVGLLSGRGRVPDSLTESDALLSFKFFGDRLSNYTMPFSYFKSLVDNVYSLVRSTLTPSALSKGHDRDVIDFPLRPPVFASLLIAVDKPQINSTILSRKSRIRNLKPEYISEKVMETGKNFASKLEETTGLAGKNRLTDAYAAENFQFLQSISGMLPAADGHVHRLQISSYIGNARTFIDADQRVGDRIRASLQNVSHREVMLIGVVIALVERSSTFRLRQSSNREITCQLTVGWFSAMLDNGQLFIGAKIKVVGRYTKRDYIDWMHVTEEPNFLE